MNTHDWLQIAKRRFPTHVVVGNGRFALYTPAAGEMGKILLFETREAAQAQILDPKQVQIVDLAPVQKVCRTIGDPYDADEARRERRERQRNA